MQDVAIGLLRHALQLIGGVLIARGVVDGPGWDLVAGAATSAATAGWYLWGKRNADRP